MIPDSVEHTVRQQTGLALTESRAVHGGSINSAAMVMAKNQKYFLKWNHHAPDQFFEKEAEGLQALRDANHSIIVPRIITTGNADTGCAFLLMEYVETGRSGDSFQFGTELANLHNNHSDQFGFHSDNFIGSLYQSNKWHSSWADFYYTERLQPQLKMAIDTGKMDRSMYKHLEMLASRLDELLPPAKPSLIHGDLWSGNYLFNSGGQAVLIDPAVYYGHPEMDLAFSTMFGGFSNEFYRGYESVSQLAPNFKERIPIYNLYPLLVHVNLFGGHYINQAVSILRRFR